MPPAGLVRRRWRAVALERFGELSALCSVDESFSTPKSNISTSSTRPTPHLFSTPAPCAVRPYCRRQLSRPASAPVCATTTTAPERIKVDWALSEPIPWSSRADCRRAATIHIGGSLAEIAVSESAAFTRQALRPPLRPARPQPSLFDPTRAPRRPPHRLGLLPYPQWLDHRPHRHHRKSSRTLRPGLPRLHPRPPHPQFAAVRSLEPQHGRRRYRRRRDDRFAASYTPSHSAPLSHQQSTTVPAV